MDPWRTVKLSLTLTMASTPAHIRRSARFALVLLVTTGCAHGQSAHGPLLLQITSSSGNTIPKGLTKQLQATRSFFRGTAPVGNVTREVTWKSSAASVATIDNNGLVTAAGQGTAIITATSGPLHAGFSITVTPHVLLSLTISPTNDDIAIGATKIFGVSGNYSDGPGPVTVNFTSSQPGVATIDNGGTATGKTDGTTTITATEPVSTKSVTAVLNVGLNSIAVAPVNPSIPLGTTQQFKATGMFSGGGSSDVTNDVVWTSSSPLIATISASGLATSANASVNPTTITAASGTVNNSTALTVTPPTLVKILVTPLNPALLVGTVQQFTATGVYTDNSNQNLTSVATWSSSVTTVASVGMNTGVVTTIAVGKTTISAMYAGVTGSSIVSVRPGSRFAYIGNQSDGTISIYALNENSGNLRDIGYAVNPSGQGQESITTDVNGKFLYLANAASSEISGFAINNATGELSPLANSPFTAGLQPSSIVLDASGKFAYVTNQGSGNLSAFSIDAGGNLLPLTVPTYSAGSGPVQAAFDPSGSFLYVADSAGNTISAFKFNADGSLTSLGAPTPSGGNGPQAMAFDASGAHLYVLNKSSNQINILNINSSTGALSLAGGSYPVGANSLAMISDPTGARLYAASAGSNTVYGFGINPATGALTNIAGSPFAVPGSPQALAMDAAGFYVYTVNGSTDEASIFAVQANGVLVLVKSTRARKAPGAMVFSAGSSGQFLPAFAEVTTENSTNGGLLSYSIDAASGSLAAADSVAIGTQGSNAVATDPTGKFVYTLEETDGKISAFTLDSFGVLTSVSGSPFSAGSNPFALGPEPSGRFLYAAGLPASNNVQAYQINSSSGALSAVTGSPFSAGGEPLSIAADPTGAFLYAGNFGPNTISAFTIDAASGTLTAVTPPFTSAAPRAIAVHPTGRFLYVANLISSLSTRIQLFGIDPNTGSLTGGTFNVPAGSDPVSIAIDPEGRFLYVANFGDGTITAFAVDQNSGHLSQIAAPYGNLSGPNQVSVDPSGVFLYAVEQNADQVTVYSVDQSTGALTRGSSFPAVSAPNSIAITASFQ